MNRTIFFLIIIWAFLWGQNASDSHYEILRRQLLEKKLQTELQQKQIEQQLLPLQQKIAQLQNQKDHQEELPTLQRRALKLSQQMVTLQNELDTLNIQLSTTNQMLYKQYTRQLDSLQNLIRQEPNQSKRESLLNQMRMLSEKRLLVSPGLDTFSLNLQVLEKLDLKSINDTSKKAILIDYLQNLLKEIKEQQQRLKLKQQELLQMVRLRQKASTFVNEIDNTRLSSSVPFQQKQQTGIRPNGVSREGNYTDVSSRQTEQPVAIVELPQIDQLINQTLKAKTSVPIDSVLKSIERANRMLEDYKQRIQNKLEH